MALGCFLDELCPEPVNHLKGTPELVRQRKAEALRGEGPLADRNREAAPQAIVVVMKGIAANVLSAMNVAGADAVPMHAFSFPSRPEHTAAYVAELSEYLAQLRGFGIVRRSSASGRCSGDPVRADGRGVTRAAGATTAPRALTIRLNRGPGFSSTFASAFGTRSRRTWPIRDAPSSQRSAGTR